MSLNQMSLESTESKLEKGTYTFQGCGPMGPEKIKSTRNFSHFPLFTSKTYDKPLVECMTIWMKPVPKPRETRADRWKKRPSVIRFRFFRDVVKKAMEELKFIPSNQLGLLFYLQMPKMSRKKQMDVMFSPHTKRPDLDNLEKATVDALFAEDAVVHMKISRKVWSLEPRIQIWNFNESLFM